MNLSKHVNVKYQFMVDHVSKENVQLHYVWTNLMIADILTKNSRNAKIVNLLDPTNMEWWSMGLMSSKSVESRLQARVFSTVVDESEQSQELPNEKKENCCDLLF